MSNAAALCARPGCDQPLPPQHSKNPNWRGRTRKWCSVKCQKRAWRTSPRGREAKLEQRAKERAEAKLHKPGPSPTMRDRAKAGSTKLLSARPKSAEEAARLGWPEPHKVIAGLALYRCSPLQLYLSPQQCDFSRKIARGQVAPDGKMGHPVDKAAAQADPTKSCKVQLYRDELEARAMTCAKCPGVLGLAVGRKYKGWLAEDEMPRANRTTQPLVNALMRGE